jgi:hypothetical protein
MRLTGEAFLPPWRIDSTRPDLTRDKFTICTLRIS